LLIADQSLPQAERAAARVNQLSGRPVAHPIEVEVQNEDAVVSMLTGAAIEVLISGVQIFRQQLALVVSFSQSSRSVLTACSPKYLSKL
jgi:hypothetical protein